MKPRFVTQSIGLALLIPLFLFILASQPYGEESAQPKAPSPWAKAREALNKFMREPSSSTIREFYLSISTRKVIDTDKTEILEYIFGPDPKRMSPSSVQYRCITMEMLSGDIYAARSAIRLLGFVYSRWQSPPSYPADEAEIIMTSLGKLVRVNPALFLRACYEERRNPYLNEKGYPVDFIPDTMKQTMTRASYELEMRGQALRSVDDPKLQLVKDKCLEALEREVKKYSLDSPGPEKQEMRPLDDPKEKVHYVLSEMVNRPSPENMKKVLTLFNDRGEELYYVTAAIFPLVKLPDKEWPPKSLSDGYPLSTILHEAQCGNVHAIEVSFSALREAFLCGDSLAIQLLDALISNLILMKPAMFIDKAAEYRYLETERPGFWPERGPANYLDYICNDVDFRSYLEPAADNVILKRRIAALKALNMPEHEELIRRCIGYIEKTLAEQKRTKG